MTPRDDHETSPLRRALRIALLYLVVAGAWVAGSDYVARMLAGEASRLFLFQLAKGLGFVLVTSAALFVLIRNAMRRIQRSQEETVRTAEQRRELAGYLNAVIEAAPLAVFDLDTDARVRRLWNPAAERLFGLPRARVLGTRPPIVTEETRSRIAEAGRRIGRGERVPLLEAQLRRSDGGTFPAAVSAAPLRSMAEQTTVVIVSDVTEQQKTVRRLEAALEQRDALLREVHHRVKNNLQIISSLLVLEGGHAAADGTEHRGLRRALSRVRAIARVHEQLYHGSDLTRIDLARYLKTLCDDIAAGHERSGSIDVDLDLDPVLVAVDSAVPLGLILHELVANAYQHAFPPDASGRIHVAETHEGARIRLVVEDDGVGMDVSRPRSPSSLGLTLVDALVAQIEGELTTESDGGTRVSVQASVGDGA